MGLVAMQAELPVLPLPLAQTAGTGKTGGGAGGSIMSASAVHSELPLAPIPATVSVSTLDPPLIDYVLTDTDGQSDAAQLAIYAIDQTQTGTSGADSIVGGSENDAIFGDDGDDVLSGNAGND